MGMEVPQWCPGQRPSRGPWDEVPQNLFRNKNRICDVKMHINVNFCLHFVRHLTLFHMLRELNLNWAILLATVNRDELMCNIQRLAFHMQVLCLVCRNTK